MIPADVYAEIEQCRLKLGSIAVDSPERRKLIHELLQQIEPGSKQVCVKSEYGVYDR